MALKMWSTSKRANQANRPKPIPRPGFRPVRYGKLVMSLEEAEEYMERRMSGLPGKEVE